jgi:hypothetical protein
MEQAIMKYPSIAAALLILLFSAPLSASRAEVMRSDASLSGRRICWFSGLDSEQYNRDHSYVYSYHTRLWDQMRQYVVRGAWSFAPDGSVVLTMDGGGSWIRKYEVNGDRVSELTGSLDGGHDGYFCGKESE